MESIEMNDELLQKYQNVINYENADIMFKELKKLLDENGPDFIFETQHKTEEDCVKSYVLRANVMRFASEAIEHYCKAILIQNGKTWADSKSFGHNLMELFNNLDNRTRNILKNSFVYTYNNRLDKEILTKMKEKTKEEDITNENDTIKEKEITNGIDLYKIFIKFLSDNNFKMKENLKDSNDYKISEEDKTNLLNNNKVNKNTNDNNFKTNNDPETNNNYKISKEDETDLLNNNMIKKNTINDTNTNIFLTNHNIYPITDGATFEEELDKFTPQTRRDQPIGVKSRYPGQTIITGDARFLTSLAYAFNELSLYYRRDIGREIND